MIEIPITNPLPRLILVTNRHLMKPSFLVALEEAVLAGARMIQLREKDLARAEQKVLLGQAIKICRPANTKLLVNSAMPIDEENDVDGIHLPQSHIDSFTRLDRQKLLGCSVHDLDSARQAEQLEPDYMIFGPVFPTLSHPGAAAAGLERLQEIWQSVGCPVYAIGGVDESNAKDCMNSGAFGVACMRAVWEAKSISDSVKTLLREIAEQRNIS